MMIDEKTDNGLPPESRGRSGLDKIMNGILRPGRLPLMIAGGMRPWAAARDRGKPRLRDLARAVSHDDLEQVAVICVCACSGLAGGAITTWLVALIVIDNQLASMDPEARLYSLTFIGILFLGTFALCGALLYAAFDDTRSLLEDLKDRVSQSRV